MFEVCAECGSNPVNHLSAWGGATFEVAVNSARLPRLMRSGVSRLASGSEALALRAWSLMQRPARALRILSFGHDASRALTGRSRVMWEEASRRGLAVQQIFLLGVPTELFQVSMGGRTRVFQSLPIPPTRSSAAWQDDKLMLKDALRKAGVAAPRSVSVTTLEEALAALKECGGVACVKPRVGSNGRHTFPYVRSEEELEYAFKSAKKLCRFVIVEEHLEGNLVRATCVDGELVGFLESESPAVIGDGRSTIRELIDKANDERPERVGAIEIGPVHERYIARRGYTLQSVLEKGKRLPLTYWAGYSSGGRSTERGVDIHPQLKEEIERAARLTELPVVGFDVIIENAHALPAQQKWGIIEANSLPWIDLHENALYGAPVSVAARIWDLWGKQNMSTRALKKSIV